MGGFSVKREIYLFFCNNKIQKKKEKRKLKYSFFFSLKDFVNYKMVYILYILLFIHLNSVRKRVGYIKITFIF